MQEEPIPRAHRRTVSQNDQFNRRNFTNQVNNGYLFDREKKRSHKKHQANEFDILVKKIEEKLATHRSRKSLSKNHSRNDSRKKLVNHASNSNMFRVLGKSIS